MDMVSKNSFVVSVKMKRPSKLNEIWRMKKIAEVSLKKILVLVD